MTEQSSLKITVNGRGFHHLEFKDLYGIGCSIQKSSLATDDAIWFGVNDADPKILASDVNQINPETGEISGWVKYPVDERVMFHTRMHLSREQVLQLLPILTKFAATGDLK